MQNDNIFPGKQRSFPSVPPREPIPPYTKQYLYKSPRGERNRTIQKGNEQITTFTACGQVVDQFPNGHQKVSNIDQLPFQLNTMVLRNV